MHAVSAAGRINSRAGVLNSCLILLWLHSDFRGRLFLDGLRACLTLIHSLFLDGLRACLTLIHSRGVQQRGC